MIDLKELNDVDWEVIKWKAQGLTTKEISEVMVLSHKLSRTDYLKFTTS